MKAAFRSLMPSSNSSGTWTGQTSAHLSHAVHRLGSITSTAVVRVAVKWPASPAMRSSRVEGASSMPGWSSCRRRHRSEMLSPAKRGSVLHQEQSSVGNQRSCWSRAPPMWGRRSTSRTSMPSWARSWAAL